MKVDSHIYRAFYSGHYDSKLDSKPGEYLVLNYQKASSLLDNIDLAQKFNDSEKYLVFKEKLEDLKTQYFSALCNRYMGVVFNSGRKIISKSISDSDLVSYGEEVLLQCITKYRKNEKVSFVTYFTRSVFNMAYTLVRKKHFRNWNLMVTSLDSMMENEEGNIFEFSDDKKLQPLSKRKHLSLNSNTLNRELDKLIFDRSLVDYIKVSLGIKDDLFLHYLILKTKHKRDLLNKDEYEKLTYLETTYKNDYDKFSKIYMYDSNTDDYTETNKTNLKEEILCQE